MSTHRKLMATLVSFALVVASVSVMPIPAYSFHCGGVFKRTATAKNTDAGDKRGNFAQSIPHSASVCGGNFPSEGSYVHIAVVHWTDQVVRNFVEGLWYFGYSDDDPPSSSTTKPAYRWIKYNELDGVPRQSSDVSRATGLYPDWGDTIETTVMYDYTDASGRDFFRIDFRNVGKAYTISVTDIYASSKGTVIMLQSESFNQNNVVRGKALNADYRDIALVWHDWTSSFAPLPDDPLCIDNIQASPANYKFGTKVNGVCSYPP